MALRDRIQDDMKSALRAKDKERLAAIRLILAGIQQREVDERITLDDSQVIAVLERMLKQRRESITQFQGAGRDDLVARESFESDIIQGYMPAALTEPELDALIESALAATGATAVRDMGRVMGVIKDQAQGRVDMTKASARVKKWLSG
jgi:hypothetical protein